MYQWAKYYLFLDKGDSVVIQKKLASLGCLSIHVYFRFMLWKHLSLLVFLGSPVFFWLEEVDLQTSFQDTKFQGIYESMKNNLNISRIQISGDENIANDFPYTLESDNWKQIQMEGLESGNKSRSVR